MKCRNPIYYPYRTNNLAYQGRLLRAYDVALRSALVGVPSMPGRH